VPWAKVRQFAQAGADEVRILRGLGLEEQRLRELGCWDRFQRDVAQWNQQGQLELLSDIRDRSKRSKRNSGSVNAMALRARNQLGWDRQVLGQESEPDLSVAHERLREELVKLAGVRSQIEGRTVTVPDLFFRDAFGRWPWEPAPAEPDGGIPAGGAGGAGAPAGS
jgi:hypothetical protein